MIEVISYESIADSIATQIREDARLIRCPVCNGLNRDDGQFIMGREVGTPPCCDHFTEGLFLLITRMEGPNPMYPDRMKQAAQMIEGKKLIDLEFQIRNFRKNPGDDTIWCPYCGLGVTQRAGSLCCEPLALAISGILVKLEAQQQIDAAARIADRAQDSACVN